MLTNSHISNVISVLMMILLTNVGFAQQDCFDAISVCTNSYSQNTGYAGIGNVNEIPSGTSCINNEVNSVWYVFTIVTSGELTFQITPSDATVDYDFSVYNLSVDSCQGIVNGTNLPISCNRSAAVGATGLSVGASETSQGTSGTNQNAPINVTQGETYALMVSNFTASQAGYELNFGGTASVVDQNPPTVASLDAGTQCNPTEVFLELNEPIACASVQFTGGDFDIAGPGNYNIQSATAINCNSEGYSTTIRLVFDSPIAIVGTYSISVTAGVGGSTVTDFCGNEMAMGTVGTFTVSQPGPVVTFANVVNTQCGANNGGATINITGGSPPYNISWSTGNNQNQTTHNNLGPGTYFVTVGDQNGCSANNSFIIQNSNPITAISQDILGVTCYESTDGYAELLVSNGSGNYSYTWNTSPTQTGPIGTNLPGGTVSVTITDNVTNCTISQNVSIPRPAPIALPITTIEPSCGASDGEATVAPTGGNGGFTYSWNTSPVQTTATATGLSAGVYQITATDNQGCNETSTVVLADDNPPTASIVASTPDCNGQGIGSAIAQADPTSGTSPFTYEWNTTPVQTGPTAINLSEGDYYVTVTDANGCSQIINVKIDTASIPSVTGVLTQPSCGQADGEIEAVVNNGTQPFAFVWSSSANTTSIESNLAEGTYTVELTDANGCIVTESFTLNQLPPVSEVNITNACLGDPNTFAFTTTSGATSWLWDFGDGNTSTDANPTHTYANSGDFQVSLTLSGGCEPDQVTETASSYQPPTAEFAIDPTLPTTQDLITFNPQGSGIANFNFTWNFGDGNTSTDANPQHQYEVEGFYNIALLTTDANGCVDDTTITIEVTLAPAVYFPNAFMPTGTPENSTFKGYGIGIVEAELSVFDRWGTLLYFSNSSREIQVNGWDGTYKGKPLHQGAYPFKAKVKFYTGVEFEKYGTVTLIR